LVLRCNGAIEKLDATSTVLGLFEQWDCCLAEQRLFPGDTFVLYTDGITESFDLAGEEYGEQRLITALLRHRDLAPQAAIASVVEEVQNFSSHRQHDDITLIIAKSKAGEPLPLFRY
jgi:sigma-B regulation protein RsbU (phosphoserine phosphatase)